MVQNLPPNALFVAPDLSDQDRYADATDKQLEMVIRDQKRMAREYIRQLRMHAPDTDLAHAMGEALEETMQHLRIALLERHKRACRALLQEITG